MTDNPKVRVKLIGTVPDLNHADLSHEKAEETLADAIEATATARLSHDSHR
jgi:hypothetical protein